MYPEPQSNMWSLGVILYQILTDGDSPYDHDIAMDSINELIFLLHGRVSPSILRPEMQRMRVPSRWQELICKLLELVHH